MSDTDTAKLYQKTSRLLKTWGGTVLPSGKTLSETMQLRGIPLWELMCPELAVYILPKIFFPKGKISSLIRSVRPYCGRSKQILLEYLLARKSETGCSIWPKDATNLILGFSPGMYSEVLEPIARHLSAQYSSSNIVLSDSWSGPGASAAIGSSKTNYQSIWQHWSGRVQSDAETMLKELNRIGSELKAMNALGCVLALEDQSCLADIRVIFIWLLRQRLPQLIPHAAVAGHILNCHKPSLIISGDVADPRTRIYSFLGRLSNIPSLEIQYGLALRDSVEYRFSLADRVAAFGEQSRRIMREHGVPLERIVVTGSPRHDRLINPDIDLLRRIRSELGVPNGNTMVLFAAPYYISGFPDVKRLGNQITEDLFAAADRSQRMTLVVKPHPILNQSGEIKKIAGKRSNIVFADPKANIQNLILACDSFIALGSTTTLDALIAGKLTITPAYPGWTANDSFIESGATMVPRSAAELMQSVGIAEGPARKRALSDLAPARNRFLGDFIFKADGRAVDRIADIVREMSRIPNKQ